MPPYATISFHKDDILRFLNIPYPLTRELEPIIANAWAPGIARDEPEPTSHTYRLRGKPWSAKGDASAIASRRLIRDILSYFYARDWLLITSLGHSVRVGSKDTIVLKNMPAAPPSYASSPAAGTLSPRSGALWLAVSITGKDIIRLDCAHEALAQDTIRTARAAVEREGYLQTATWNCDAYEFKLRDKPWNAHGDSGWERPRHLILALFEALETMGWRSYGSVMQSTEDEDEKRADSWYFILKGRGAHRAPPNGGELEEPLYEL